MFIIFYSFSFGEDWDEALGLYAAHTFQLYGLPVGGLEHLSRSQADLQAAIWNDLDILNKLQIDDLRAVDPEKSLGVQFLL